MEIQPQLVLLQKTLLYIEGLGRELYPELDLWETAKPFMERWMAERIGPAAALRALAEYAPEIIDQLPRLPLVAPVLDDAGDGMALPVAVPSRAAAMIQLGLGGLLAWWGGLLSLAVVAGLVVDPTEGEERVHLLLGTAVIGLLPLALGLWLFRRGLVATSPRRRKDS